MVKKIFIVEIEDDCYMPVVTTDSGCAKLLLELIEDGIKGEPSFKVKAVYQRIPVVEGKWMKKTS